MGLLWQHSHSLKFWRNFHCWLNWKLGKIFITGCAGSCHFDNFQCSQWWKCHQNKNMTVLAFCSRPSHPIHQCSQRHAPHPTNDISIEFEIRLKFEVPYCKMYSTDYNEILHISRQCNCRDVCKISSWLVKYVLNYSIPNFVGRARGLWFTSVPVGTRQQAIRVSIIPGIFIGQLPDDRGGNNNRGARWLVGIEGEADVRLIRWGKYGNSPQLFQHEFSINCLANQIILKWGKMAKQLIGST